MRGLRVLALNACGIISWSSVQLLERYLPAIEELYLAQNDLSDLPKPSDLTETLDQIPDASIEAAVAGFKKMRLLDLSNCKINSWHQILTLRDLPDLAELILDSNPLPSVLQCPADDKVGCVSFPSLQRLSLSCTKLSAWSDIDHLATYRTCAFMRLSQVPLFMGKGASEVRPLIIGRMPSLVFFNGSAISPRERTDAEKSYLRSIIFAIDDAQASGKSVDVGKEHPRYLEIKAKYGADLLPMGKALEGSDIASNLINVTLKNLTFASGGTLEPLKKKIPSSITINRLKVMVKQLYGLDHHLQFLSIRLYKDAVPILLDDEMSSLGYYGATDGVEIFINEASSA